MEENYVKINANIEVFDQYEGAEDNYRYIRR